MGILGWTKKVRRLGEIRRVDVAFQKSEIPKLTVVPNNPDHHLGIVGIPHTVGNNYFNIL
jgi:hypothetical protein